MADSNLTAAQYVQNTTGSRDNAVYYGTTDYSTGASAFDSSKPINYINNQGKEVVASQGIQDWSFYGDRAENSGFYQYTSPVLSSASAKSQYDTSC
jgi:hypothetical protein